MTLEDMEVIIDGDLSLRTKAASMFIQIKDFVDNKPSDLKGIYDAAVNKGDEFEKCIQDRMVELAKTSIKARVPYYEMDSNLDMIWRAKDMKQYYVYVAGSIMKPEPAGNIKKGVEQCEQLLKLGFVPFSPFNTDWFKIGQLANRSTDEWLEYDYAWILKCDAVFAMPGESLGRDKEIEFANQNKIPVFWCLRAISEWREKQIEEWKWFGHLTETFGKIN